LTNGLLIIMYMFTCFNSIDWNFSQTLFVALARKGFSRASPVRARLAQLYMSFSRNRFLESEGSCFHLFSFLIVQKLNQQRLRRSANIWPPYRVSAGRHFRTEPGLLKCGTHFFFSTQLQIRTYIVKHIFGCVVTVKLVPKTRPWSYRLIQISLFPEKLVSEILAFLMCS
jgi:hypothetical protein